MRDRLEGLVEDLKHSRREAIKPGFGNQSSAFVNDKGILDDWPEESIGGTSALRLTNLIRLCCQ